MSDPNHLTKRAVSCVHPQQVRHGNRTSTPRSACTFLVAPTSRSETASLRARCSVNTRGSFRQSRNSGPRCDDRHERPEWWGCSLQSTAKAVAEPVELVATLVPIVAARHRLSVAYSHRPDHHIDPRLSMDVVQRL